MKWIGRYVSFRSRIDVAISSSFFFCSIRTARLRAEVVTPSELMEAPEFSSSLNPEVDVVLADFAGGSDRRLLFSVDYRLTDYCRCIVLRLDAVDVGVGSKQVMSGLLITLLIPVGGYFVDDFDVGILAEHCLVTYYSYLIDQAASDTIGGDRITMLPLNVSMNR